MPPKVTLKLLTNLPAIGTVKFVDFYEEKENPKEPGKMMSAQWGFTGTFDLSDGQGPREGRIYCDTYQLSADPVHLGMAIPDGTDTRTGAPRYKWTERGPIHLVKREDGRKRLIQIARVGEATAPIPAQQTPPGAFVPQAPIHLPTVPANAIPWPTHHPATDVSNHPISEKSDEWAALEARYARCVDMAHKVWHDVGSRRLDDQSVVAAAATLFIEANKEHLQTAPVSAALRSLGSVQTTTSPTTTLDTSGPPRPEQIAQFRALLGTDDHYGGGPLFDQRERQELMALLGTATSMTLNAAILRMQKAIATRTTRPPQPASRTAGGPGMPGAGFEQMPEALDDPELSGDLPF